MGELLRMGKGERSMAVRGGEEDGKGVRLRLRATPSCSSRIVCDSRFTGRGAAGLFLLWLAA